MNKFTLPFKKINKKSIEQAGGKGASLGEMQNNGFPIPSGFVVLASTFEKYLDKTDLNVEIEAALKRVNSKDMESVENASEVISHLIKRTSIDFDIEKEILVEFKKLKAKFVAVRSSATAEDSKVDSWAGELESYLNTTNKTLIENVKKCWMSLFTPRAIFYRFARKLEKQAISVAVVVQEMVESEISGVAFSVHPITKDHNQMIIEAGWGLGEAIVLGKITPDSYVVSKKDEEIAERGSATPALSQKPALIACNVGNGDSFVFAHCDLKIDAKLELELSDMNLEEINELNLESSLPKLIEKAYETLGLVSFYTVKGNKEIRAWPVKKETPVSEAAGIVHSDFKERFIRAEVIQWEKLLETKSLTTSADLSSPWQKAREKGWLRGEGRDYIVQDGDVIEFKI